MKKALALVLAGVMALSLAACGSTPSSTATSGALGDLESATMIL